MMVGCNEICVYMFMQPNSMGIDLRDVKDEFYLKVKELNMVRTGTCVQCVSWKGAMSRSSPSVKTIYM